MAIFGILRTGSRERYNTPNSLRFTSQARSDFLRGQFSYLAVLRLDKLLLLRVRQVQTL